MGRVAVLATCAMSQWALDFQGNKERIIESIIKAKEAGASYLCGTEMNITGYGCEDHHHEIDTEMHAWEVLASVMQHASCLDIMVDVGLPIRHKNVIYNCKLVFLNRKVLFIRPKMILANDGSLGYRETRWFTPWTKIREVENFPLPSIIKNLTGQKSVPFGDGMIQTNDTTIGYEICEELWNPESCHIGQYLDGAEIISNGLGSFEEFGRPDIGYKMVQMATGKSGGCYLLANQKGCDGSQGFYGGDACIGLNGGILAQAKIHSLEEVDVITAAIDLEAIRHYKASIRSRCEHAAKSKSYPRIEVDFCITKDNWWSTGIPRCDSIEPYVLSKAEQILEAAAHWFWDYLRRSGRKGILIPLESNIESFATAAIVFSMCHMVVEAVSRGNEKVLADVRQLVGKSDFIPKSTKDLCGHLVHTLYIETSFCDRSLKDNIDTLVQEIGSDHSDINLDNVLGCTTNSLASMKFNLKEEQVKYNTEKKKNIAQRNLESRLAMVAAYYAAEVFPLTSLQDEPLIVLSSASIEKSFMGSQVKYGKYFGDLNLIGRFSEEDLISFLHLAKERLGLPSLMNVVPPNTGNSIASDFISLQLEGCGPYSMLGRLLSTRDPDTSTKEVAESVKEFYRCLNSYRQKRIGLPPVCYLAGTGPCDRGNPLIYPINWTWQFKSIDRAVKQLE